MDFRPHLNPAFAVRASVPRQGGAGCTAWLSEDRACCGSLPAPRGPDWPRARTARGPGRQRTLLFTAAPSGPASLPGHLLVLFPAPTGVPASSEGCGVWFAGGSWAACPSSRVPATQPPVDELPALRRAKTAAERGCSQTPFSLGRMASGPCRLHTLLPEPGVTSMQHCHWLPRPTASLNGRCLQ